MHAIICLGEGAYYISTVFGFYKDITAEDEYQRYLQNTYNQYYIVLDKEKKKLTRHYTFDESKSPNLVLRILLLDEDTDGWLLTTDGCGGVDFLPQAEVTTMIDRDCFPAEIISRCLYLDGQFQYHEYQEIRTKKDADNLLLVSGCFHDGIIKRIEKTRDGSLYILFAGLWGCSIGMWLSEDVTYNPICHEPEAEYYYWLEAELVLADGFIWLYESDQPYSDLRDNDWWFRARKMKYHIIPN